MGRQLFARTCGLMTSLIVLVYVGRGMTTPVHSAPSAPSESPALSVPCRPIAASSATVRSCQLKGHGFASVEPIRISYTLEIPVRPELVAIHPTPKLWGLEPPRVQCLTTRPNACVRDRTSEGGVFGPLLVHLTSLKLPYAGGAAEQHFRVTVRGAKGDQATIVLPNSIVHADGPVRR